MHFKPEATLQIGLALLSLAPSISGLPYPAVQQQSAIAKRAPGDQLWGPTQFCQTLSHGGGPPSCIDIPERCFIIVPSFNIVPTVQCAHVVSDIPSTATESFTTTQEDISIETTGAPVAGDFIEADGLAKRDPKGNLIPPWFSIPVSSPTPVPTLSPSASPLPSPSPSPSPSPVPVPSPSPSPAALPSDANTNGIAPENILDLGKRAASGEQLFGPTSFCQALGPGGARSCISIPEGCFIVVPFDNSIPSVQCPTDGISAPSNADTDGIAESVAPVKVKRNLKRGGQRFGPGKVCLGLKTGGQDSCIWIGAGCYVNEPLGDTIPEVHCPGIDLSVKKEYMGEMRDVLHS